LKNKKKRRTATVLVPFSFSLSPSVHGDAVAVGVPSHVRARGHADVHVSVLEKALTCWLHHLHLHKRSTPAIFFFLPLPAAAVVELRFTGEIGRHCTTST
jgi:hypothetical protein